MAENEGGDEDRTEDATPERREDFREKGQVAFSRDLASVLSLGALVYVMYIWWGFAPRILVSYSRNLWSNKEYLSPDVGNIGLIMSGMGLVFLQIVVPLFLIVTFTSAAVVFLQTRFNVSFQRLNFDFNRLNPVSGLSKIVSGASVVELIKNLLKLFVIGFISYLVLASEWRKIPTLMFYPMGASWLYWGVITKDLFYAVLALLIAISGGDYFYQFMTLEKQLKMTKEEVRQEYKQREVDPNVRQKMRRMQRENTARSKVARTKTATVLITNPTHFSIALKYELGFAAPILIAKGEDDIALRMRVAAKESKIPIVENKTLARALYAQVEEGDEVPSKFYAAVAEVIRYVFKLQGKKIGKKKNV